MRETEKRIRMYQAQLPFAKEKVIASLLIFAFSIAMITMTAFAWTTLSVAPEVSGATTTITANGNLEIALAGLYEPIYETKEVQKTDENNNPMVDDDGNPIMETVYVLDSKGNKIVKEIIPLPPSDSAVGDSVLSIQQRNTTWGNLINLSDPSYGLDEIILRPAKLNTGSLAKNPFVSAQYGEDGRVEDTTANFKYTIYDSALEQFVQSEVPGVRAVSSVLEERLGITSQIGAEYTDVLDKKVDKLLRTAYDGLKKAIGTLDLASNPQTDAAKNNALGDILEVYLNGLLYGTLEKGSTKPNGDREAGPIYFRDREDVGYLLEMMRQLERDAVNPFGQALIEIFYLYQLDTYVDKSNYGKEGYVIPDTVKSYSKDTTPDIDAFLAEAKSILSTLDSVRESNKLPELPSEEFESVLSEYQDIRANLQLCIEEIQKQYDDTTTYIYWYEVKDYINLLVDIPSALINDEAPNDNTEKTLSYWFGLLSNAMGNISQLQSVLGMLDFGYEENKILIRQGILKDLTALLYDDLEGVKISQVRAVVEKSAVEAKMAGSSASGLVDSIFKEKTKTLRAHITTDAVREDLDTGKPVPNAVKNLIASSKTALKAEYAVYEYIAQETYGLAIDFWIRSNVPESYLILEGEVELAYKDVISNVYVITDAERGTGEYKEVKIYLATVKKVQTFADGSGPDEEITENVEIYTLDNKVWYYLESGKEIGTEEARDDNGNLISTTVHTLESDPVKKQEAYAVGYSGANRIWDKDDLFSLGDQIKYSTSQGSGSCYTFYADPSELNTILGVLEFLRVVFIDINGNELATAKLDTQYCFSEYGRHIVPLVLYDNYDSVENKGETYRAITSLTKNEATFISALVYLDGTNIENKDVLASADIKGQFNIQFGTTFDEEALKNEDLMNETLKITASATPTEWDKDATEYKTTVTLGIEGMTPTRVTANFTRQINSTQGSLQETMVFGFDKTTGKWISDYTFTAPGKYILRSVTIDGIERMLTEDRNGDGKMDDKDWIVCEIDGFVIGELMSTNRNGTHYTVLTADNYYTEGFQISIAAGASFPEPTSVKGVFTSKDNVNVDINFAKGEGSFWKGTAFFSTSGEYTLSYLLIDGQYYEVDSFVREVSLGLKTRVWVTLVGNPETEFDKENEKYQYDPAKGYTYVYYNKNHTFAVSVEIYDASGNEIKRLGGADGLLVKYNGEDTNVYWDAAKDRYVGGEFEIEKVGSYTFEYVSIPIVGEREPQKVTTATLAPSITVMSGDPFVYLDEDDGYGVETSTQEFIVLAAEGSVPQVSLNFMYATSAKIYGKFVIKKDKYDPIDADTNKFTVLQAIDSENNDSYTYNGKELDIDVFTFNIPEEDGYYELVEVKMTNIYYESEDKQFKKFYTSTIDLDENNFDEVDLNVEEKDKQYYTLLKTETDGQLHEPIKVIKDLHVVYNEKGYKTTFNGAFLESYQLFGDGVFEITITDFEDMVIKKSDGSLLIDSLKLYIDHDDMSMKEFYDTADYAEISSTYFDIDVVFNKDTGTYVSSVQKPISIYLAGNYAVDLKSTAIGKDGKPLFEASATDMPDIRIESEKPTVKITDVDTDNHAGNEIKLQGTSATVYMRQDTTTSIRVENWRPVTVTLRHYTASKVTITLSDSGYAKSAKLSFYQDGSNIDSRLYSENSGYSTTGSAAYTWGGSNTVENGCDGGSGRYVGYSEYGVSNVVGGSKTPLGSTSAKATMLELTNSENITFYVVVDLTINNPS